MQNREYNKLFLGVNEDLGKDKISLTYSVSSKQFVFYTDTNNIFTYPEYALSSSISATSLINDGAFGGIYPGVADVITYASNCIPISSSIRDSFGIYLGTWLYKPELDSDDNICWKDRWYNPGYISEKEAMLIPISGHTGIKDDDSKFILEPGIDYNYFRFGNYTNHNILNNIDNLNDNLKIHFENWDETNIIQENVSTNSDKYLIVNRDIPVIEKPFKNPIDANNNIIRTSNKFQNDYILDLTAQSAYTGAEYNTSTTNSIGLSGNMSSSIWMRSDNWRNGNHYHLISNGFRSGWNLKINNGFYNPLLVFASNNDGRIIVYNVEGKLLYNYDLSHSIDETISYVVDNDLYLYIFAKHDTNYYIFKVDITSGEIISQSLQPSIQTKIYFDENSNLTTTNQYPYYDLDLNGNNITSSYIFDIDNYNNIWTATPNGIYRGNNKIYDIVASKIKCSHDNKLWVIVDPTPLDQNYRLNIYDISNMDYILENSFLSVTATLNTSHIIDISSTTPPTLILFDLVYVNNETQCYIIDLEQNLIYRMMESGNYNKENFYNLTNIIDFNNDSFSTYTWNRKFNYIKHGKTPQIELNVNTSLGGAISSYNLSCSASNLVDKEWHHFGIVINQELSAINLYMDTKLVSSMPYNGDNIHYVYETPLLIGTGAGRTTALTKELKTETYDYFKGYIDDFRIYNKSLSQSDIERIYTNKFRYKDLIYNLSLSEPMYYVEEIDRFFKFNLPGAKAPYYNIKLFGLNVDESTKRIIETIIKNSIKYIAPAYTELYKIVWIE